jgi:hypothetical protein
LKYFNWVTRSPHLISLLFANCMPMAVLHPCNATASSHFQHFDVCKCKSHIQVVRCFASNEAQATLALQKSVPSAQVSEDSREWWSQRTDIRDHGLTRQWSKLRMVEVITFVCQYHQTTIKRASMPSDRNARRSVTGSNKIKS